MYVYVMCEISHSALQVANWGEKNDTTGVLDGVLRKT